MSSKNVKFVLIGAKATGKTMFIACLENGTKEKISAVGDITREYVNTKWNKLNKKDDKTGERACKLPPTPAIFKPLQFMYQHNEFGKIQFATHDYDGNFTETITVNTEKTEEELKDRIKQIDNDIYTEVFSKDENSKEALKKELAQYQEELSVVLTKKQREELLQSVKEKPKGIFFFLPYERTTERFQSFAQNIGKFIELAQFSNKSKSPIPACIVITKWDDAEGFQKENEKQTAREYLENNEYLQKVLNIVENYFEYVEITPVSSCESYNLTAPFDFGLEKTFEQWYTRALELKEEKSFKNLVLYLANRYEDMQFVKKYNFKALYEEAQKEYFNTVKKEFYAFENYEDRKKYLDDVASLFKTKPELLDPLKKSLKSELRRIKFKKVRNVTLSIVAIVTLSMSIVEYKMKLDVDEAYMSIKQRYEKKVLYPRMEMDIQKFLENYKSVNFLYAWANVPKKRIEVLKMRDDLKVQYKKWIDNKITDILTNKKLTADEKRLKLKELRSQADTLDQRKIDEIMANLGLSVNKEKWLAVAKDCLKTCEGETGKDTIATLVSQVSQGDVILDDAVQGLLNQMTEKKVSIIKDGAMEKILAKIEEQSDANTLTSYFTEQNVSIRQLPPQVQEKILVQYISFLKEKNIGQILSWFPSMESNQTTKISQTAIPDEVVASNRFRNALVVVLENEYKDELMGSNLLVDIQQNRKAEDIYKTLKDIKKKVDENKAFSKLTDTLAATSVDGLSNDLFSGFNVLTDSQKKAIYKQLKIKLTKFVNDVLTRLPDDETETNEIEEIIQEVEQMNEFTLRNIERNIDYEYLIPEDILTQVDKIKRKNKVIKNIIEYGIQYVRVTLVGKEDNYIGFGCENWSIDNTDIIITGFGPELKENDDTTCADNEMTYPQRITLKVDEYDLTISEDDWVSPDPKSATMNFSIDDLINIANNKSVPKLLGDDKLQLIFKK